MAPRELQVVLLEIECAIDGIEQAAIGKTQASLDEEWLLRHGIERGLEIISEGVRHLPEPLLSQARTSHGSRFVRSAMCYGTSIIAPLAESCGVSWSTNSPACVARSVR